MEEYENENFTPRRRSILLSVFSRIIIPENSSKQYFLDTQISSYPHNVFLFIKFIKNNFKVFSVSLFLFVSESTWQKISNPGSRTRSISSRISYSEVFTIENCQINKYISFTILEVFFFFKTMNGFFVISSWMIKSWNILSFLSWLGQSPWTVYEPHPPFLRHVLLISDVFREFLKWIQRLPFFDLPSLSSIWKLFFVCFEAWLRIFEFCMRKKNSFL